MRLVHIDSVSTWWKIFRWSPWLKRIFLTINDLSHYCSLTGMYSYVVSIQYKVNVRGSCAECVPENKVENFADERIIK